MPASLQEAMEVVLGVVESGHPTTLHFNTGADFWRARRRLYEAKRALEVAGRGSVRISTDRSTFTLTVLPVALVGGRQPARPMPTSHESPPPTGKEVAVGDLPTGASFLDSPFDTGDDEEIPL